MCSSDLRLPAWQIAVLPAAAGGFLVGRGRSGGRGLWTSAVLLAIVSTVIGEIAVFRQTLIQSARRSTAPAPSDEVHRAIAEHHGLAAPPRESEPVFTRRVAAEIYLAAVSMHGPSAALCLALSLASAVQAARMARPFAPDRP